MSNFPATGGATPAQISQGISLTHTFYVTIAGNDGNDGMSPGTGFKTIARGIQAANAVGGGNLVVENGSWPSSVSGAGLWLRGLNDIGPGGAGWVDVTTSLQIEFVPSVTPSTFSFAMGGPGIGGGAVAYSGPAVQLAGIGDTGLTFKNAAFSNYNNAFPTARIGLSSPLNTWSALTTYHVNDAVKYNNVGYVAQNTSINKQPDSNPSNWTPVRAGAGDGLVFALTSTISLVNTYFENGSADSGPCIDLGFVFWLWADQLRIVRFNTGVTELTNCGIRAWGQFELSPYLIQLNDVVVAGSGLLTIGNGEVNGTNWVGENMTFPIVHSTIGSDGFSARGVWERVTRSDTAIPYAIVNDGNVPLRITDCDPASGPCTSYSSGASGTAPTTNGLLEFGQYGICRASSQLDTGAGRRMHPPTASRYKNIAQPLSAFTAIGHPIGPDGVDGSVSGNTATLASGIQYYFYDSRNGFELPSVGDHLAWGTWLQFPDGIPPTDQNFFISNVGAHPITIYFGGPAVLSGREITIQPSENLIWYPVFPVGSTTWGWIGSWLRLITYPAGSHIQIQSWPNESRSYAKPWCIRVPEADKVTGQEVAEFMLYGANSPNVAPSGFIEGQQPSAPPIGTLGIWPTQKISFWDTTLQVWKQISIDNGALVIS